MRHLTLEEIARLVDEPPHAGEAAHLDACAACRAELAAMREQTEGLAGLADPVPPPWARLEARLESEGLLRRPPRPAYAALRMAASVAALALGGAAGAAAWHGGEEAPPTLPHAVAEAPAPPAAAPLSVESASPPEVTRLAVEIDTLIARHLPETLPFSIEVGSRALAGAEFTQMNPGLGRYFRTDEGLLTLRVAPGSPAARAGLQAGDVVLRAGGDEVETLRDLRRALARAERDERERVTLGVLREGKRRDIELEWRR